MIGTRRSLSRIRECRGYGLIAVFTQHKNKRSSLVLHTSSRHGCDRVSTIDAEKEDKRNPHNSCVAYSILSPVAFYVVGGDGHRLTTPTTATSTANCLRPGADGALVFSRLVQEDKAMG
ncbi:hypothetical protein GW17_00013956 [Ensete ventricosum]|nr:hypothetical protein GW17_00013956 [Ensete ventricosum]